MEWGGAPKMECRSCAGVLLITHDARLIKQTVNEIWVMGNKTVDTKTFSNFEDYKAHLVEKMELEVLSMRGRGRA